ncbi:MAG: DUF1996 domain-containing protein [Pseudomonadota bacterium]|nr:DUF1996 domain-containing protein [Pseudomonadota bacterium]
MALTLSALTTLAAGSARAEETRRWRTSCTFSAAAPNAAAAGHCPGENGSLYRVPALYRDGLKLTPVSLQIYYENKSLAAGELVAFPVGYHYVLDDRVTRHWIWSCGDMTQFGDKPPATCASGDIQVRSEFPNCWDGILDADGDAAKHVIWANGLGVPGRGERIADPSHNSCPDGYPKPLPMLRLTAHYLTGSRVGDLTVSSGSVESWRAEFVNGWDQTVLQGLIDKCLNHPDVTCPHFTGTMPAP